MEYKDPEPDFNIALWFAYSCGFAAAGLICVVVFLFVSAAW